MDSYDTGLRMTPFAVLFQQRIFTDEIADHVSIATGGMHTASRIGPVHPSRQDSDRATDSPDARRMPEARLCRLNGNRLLIYQDLSRLSERLHASSIEWRP